MPTSEAITPSKDDARKSHRLHAFMASMRIEVPVRVVPQLYGTSYDGKQELEEEDHFHDEWSGLAPSTVLNQVRRADQIGSCLSASLEMLIDGARTTPRKAGYSTFKGVRAPLSGSAQPNRDVVKFFWNQATLHHQIWGALTDCWISFSVTSECLGYKREGHQSQCSEPWCVQACEPTRLRSAEKGSTQTYLIQTSSIRWSLN